MYSATGVVGSLESDWDMAFEKTWLEIPAQPLLQNGGQYGLVTVTSTAGYKLKQQVRLSNSTQSTKYEVHAVLNETQMLLGDLQTGLSDFADLRAFTTALASTIDAEAQNRQPIPPDKWQRAVFEESPTVALRTFGVDSLGRPYTVDNPFPVQLSDGDLNIETLNANLAVQLTHKDNDPKPGDVHDSVRLGDGTNEAAVNPDGSLNVVVVSASQISQPTKSVFNQVTIVPAGSEIVVVSYTVPLAKKASIDQITGSGDNIGKFNVYLNGDLMDVRRTYWAGGFNVRFDFRSQGDGVILQAGDVLELKAIHTSDDLGDFDGRIQVVEFE